MLTKFRNKFNFYGLVVYTESDSSEIQLKLEKDFSYFKVNLEKEDPFLKIYIYNLRPPLNKIPNIKPVFNRKYSTTFDEGSVRYNNYRGKALTIINYEQEEVEIYSEDSNLLHELTYLIILSRVGKKMDLERLHRVHAMAFRLGRVDSIFMMNMGGGKSTLLSHLLNYKEVELISDDIPIIGKNGRVRPFPLRLGAYPEIIKEIINPNENIYKMVRQEYGTKKLISVEGIVNKIASDGLNEVQILFQGKRIKGAKCRIYKANIFQKIYYLTYNMVIGFGLPMIFEYFWETGIRDFFRKTKIAIYRMIAMFKVILVSEFYIFEIGENPEYNGKFLYEFLKEK